MAKQCHIQWRAVGVVVWFLFVPHALAICHDDFNSDESDTRETGWSGNWSTSAYLAEAAELQFASAQSLPTPKGLIPSASGGRLIEFNGIAFRGVGEGQAFDLSDPSACWYIRVAVRRSVVGNASESLGVSLLLHDRLDRILTIGCSSSGKLSISGAAEAQSPKPVMAVDHAYLWLIRLDKPGPDGRRRVCIRSFHESETLTAEEPTCWTVLSDPVLINGTIDRIGIAAGKNVHVEFDELRIARSWNEMLNH